MIKRFFTGLIIVMALLVGLGIYYLYAPNLQAPLENVEKVTINLEGRDRSYWVYYPPNLKPGASLLFALHSSMSSGTEMRSWVGRTVERFAAQENTVVVYPDGYEGHFNDCRKVASYSARKLNIDDVGFMQHIADKLVAEKGVSTEQVYALGYSIGGHLAFRLAMEAPGMLKGVVAIAANLPTADSMACKPAGLLPSFIGLVEGTEDPINPYAGGQVTLFGFGDRGNVLSANASAKWFVDTMAVSVLATESEVNMSGSMVQKKDWKSADEHISLITIVGGGHTIPQGNFRFRRILGMTLEDDSILESVLNSMFAVND